MRQGRIDFVHNPERALADPTLHSSVRRAMVRFRELQRPVIGEIEEWQALREYAHRVKLHTLSHLDQYLEQLERQIVAAGGQVHWVRDGAQAGRVIADLARSRDDRTVVKSKSMTSEEIELNQVLEAAGCEVVETDLGEYLLQLAGVTIAVRGIERVIRRVAGLGVFLPLLPRAATGQRMSSYVSLLTGPRRAGERDGPEEFHLVIMDNGRTAIQADPVMRESLACIRCGACLDVCPVFERTVGHAYGSVYSGPIGAVITPLYQGLDVAGELPFASSLCGACGEICPVKIDLPRLLLELRARVVQAGGASWAERLFVHGWVARMARSGLLRLVAPLGRVLHRAVARTRIPLPYPFSRWTQFRELPPPARASFRERWSVVSAVGRRR